MANRFRTLLLFLVVATIAMAGPTNVRAEEPEFPLVSKAAVLIKAGKTDEAIKLAKQAREDGKLTAEALVVLARCSVQQENVFKAVAYLEKAVDLSVWRASDAYAELSLQTCPRPLFEKTNDPKTLELQKQELEQFEALNRQIMAKSGNASLLHQRSAKLEMPYTHIKEEPYCLRQDFAICDSTMAIHVANSFEEERRSNHLRSFQWRFRAIMRDRLEGFQHQAEDLDRLIDLGGKPEKKLVLDRAIALGEAEKWQLIHEILPENLDGYDEWQKMMWRDLKARSLKGLKRYSEAIAAYEDAIESLKPSDKNLVHILLMDRAQCFMRLNKFPQAIADLERCAELIPEFDLARLWYQLWLRSGNEDKVQAVIDSETKPVAALEERACYYMEVGRWKEAEADLLALKEHWPDVWRIYENLAKVEEKLGKRDLAKDYIAKAQQVYETLPSSQKHSHPTFQLPFPLIIKAVALIQAGKSSEAIKLANQSGETGKLSAETLVVLAMGNYRKGRLLEAVPFLEKAVMIERDEAFRAYAEITMQLFPGPVFKSTEDPYGFHNDAAEIYAEANREIVSNPRDADLLFDRAEEVTGGGLSDYDDELTEEEGDELYYRRQAFGVLDASMAILATSDREPQLEALYFRAELYIDRSVFEIEDCYDQAVADLRRTIDLEKPEDRNYVELANALWYAEKFQEGLDLVPKSLEVIDESELLDWLSVKADCLTGLKHYPEALSVYNIMLEHEKLTSGAINPYTLHSRARCFIELGKYHQALVDLDHYLELKPSEEYMVDSYRYRVWGKLGRWDEIQAVINDESTSESSRLTALWKRSECYEEVGRWKDAEADYFAILKLRPDHWMAYEGLAKVSEKLGKPELAKQYIAKAKKYYEAQPPWERGGRPELFQPD